MLTAAGCYTEKLHRLRVSHDKSSHPQPPHVEQVDRPLHNLNVSRQAHLVLCSSGHPLLGTGLHEPGLPGPLPCQRMAPSVWQPAGKVVQLLQDWTAGLW